MYQSVQIIGNVGSIDGKYTPSGTFVLAASVATSFFRPGRDGAEGTTETEWWNLEIWSASGERFNEKVHVGDLVFVEGRIKTDKWEDADHVKHERKKLIANSWKLLKAKAHAAEVAEGADEESIF